MVRSGGFVKKWAGIVALAVVASGWVSTTSQASLIYSLVGNADGMSKLYITDHGGPQTVSLALYADITGSNPGLSMGGGSFVATCTSPTASGSFAPPTLETLLAGNSSQIGKSYTVGNFTNWGGSESNKAGFYYAVSTTNPNPVFGSHIKIGTIDFTVANLNPDDIISLQFIPRDRPTAADHIWFENYVPGSPPKGGCTDLNGGFVGMAAEFQIQYVTVSDPEPDVPEPASLSLLSLGALALLRRRMAR